MLRSTPGSRGRKAPISFLFRGFSMPLSLFSRHFSPAYSLRDTTACHQPGHNVAAATVTRYRSIWALMRDLHVINWHSMVALEYQMPRGDDGGELPLISFTLVGRLAAMRL